MSYIRNSAQEAFEEHKDDGRVQAILKVLGQLREHVIEWELTVEQYGPRNGTYRIVLSDESEIHGSIVYNPYHKEWLASGTHIPNAKQLTEKPVREIHNVRLYELSADTISGYGLGYNFED